MSVASECRTGKEKIYGALLSAFGCLGWALAALFLVFAFTSGEPKLAGQAITFLVYGVAFLIFGWLARRLYRAASYGNMVKLSEQQFPELHAMVADGARRLGMRSAPVTFLFNSNGMMNAFARRMAGQPFVHLTSQLVDVQDDEQVRFVIAHELGHHAAGHLNPWLQFLRAPGHVVPFLGPAYSRARESTCDAVGLRLTNNPRAAQAGLAMLGCGCRRLNARLNCEAFARQEEEVPAIFGFLREIFSSHPRLTRRVAAIARASAGSNLRARSAIETSSDAVTSSPVTMPPARA